MLLCCKCGEIIEILNIHTDNSKIEIKCKNCGIYEKLINDYYDELSQIKCLCNTSHNNIYAYCYECRSKLCENCKNSPYHDGHKLVLKLDEMEDYCPKHSHQFNYFCNNCQENFCEEEKEKEHKEHDIFEINPRDEKYQKYYTNIKEINEELKKIIGFNQLVLNTGKKFKNNYFHLQSIINLGESLEEGNQRISKDTKCLLYGLSKDIENSKKATEYFEDKEIHIFRNDKYIDLNEKKLEDKDFKIISHIRFNQLIEIDISENNIKNIEPFKTMNLPFLEFLNMGHNQIQIIEPITHLKYKNLKYIFLQNNKIEDLKSLLDSEFPALEILRMEDNIFGKNKNEILKQISKKHPGKFFYNSIKEEINDFKNKYNLNKAISGDNEIIDLSELNQKGDEMLKKIFLIITYKTKNKIKTLKLRNNKIKDPSILSRIHFNKLQTLDLSINEIANINFLSNFQAQNLKYLYLDHNNLNTIYPLLNADFPDLKLLTLNDNNFNLDNFEVIPEYKVLMKKENTDTKTFKIQLKHNNDVCDEKKNSDNDNNKDESNNLNKTSKTIKSQ